VSQPAGAEPPLVCPPDHTALTPVARSVNCRMRAGASPWTTRLKRVRFHVKQATAGLFRYSPPLRLEEGEARTSPRPVCAIELADC
jgi:hypothetical protein